MKIAVLGGGFTGLTAAYTLATKGHNVTVFEKEMVLGGLASGFRSTGWEWQLERAYHHLFANDYDILNFVKEIGYEDVIFRSPETASIFDVPHSKEFFITPLDTPLDLLKLPILSFPHKMRAGMILAFLKFSPFLTMYEKQTAEEFLKKTMGEKVWEVLWQELFRKKFGKYAGNIVMSFFWARIKKRSKQLGYMKGGFQTFIDFLEEANKKAGVIIHKGNPVEGVVKKGNGFEIVFLGQKKSFDAVISTLPTPVLIKLGDKLLPEHLLKRFSRIHYLHAVNLILETDRPILEKTYWLNISSPQIPAMVMVQHTNFMDTKYYGGKNIFYAANYIGMDHPLIKMTNEEVRNFYLPQIKKISNFKFKISNYYVFKGPFAQPVFDKEFIKNKPGFETPAKNFYIANLDMTYPYDRGTNYAVKLGKEVANFFNNI